MNRLFLGKPLHWALLVVAAAVVWATGSVRLHVTAFNLHTAALAAVALALIGIVLLTSRRNERITRDPLPGAEDFPH